MIAHPAPPDAAGALVLDGSPLTLDQIAAVAVGGRRAVLADGVADRMRRAVSVVAALVDGGRTAYGINTGFGRLASVRLPADDLAALQLNLVRSHACGVGPALAAAESRAMLLLRANTLAAGFSGARPELVAHLLAMLDHGIHPRVPAKGSVGASGDLAPLAHLALGVIGEGPVEYRGTTMAAADACAAAGLTPPRLGPKEGLALLNGTQAMTAVGSLALHRAMRVVALADLAGAMTLEALRGTPAAFDPRIHAARPHAGQRRVAARLRALLAGSTVQPIRPDGSMRVQDAYSLRCMPQVHGAVRGALDHVRQVLEVESGSVTDNPLVFADAGDILSGGNFHGAPLALALDYAAIAMTDLMSIGERRIERLVNPDLSEGLPAFLTASPGLSSGFMIAQVTAAALLNESKVLAHPASVDNVPTSAGQEDHVSMGMTAATKLRTIVDNAEHVLAIELLCAAQGLDVRGGPSAPALADAHRAVRDLVPALGADRVLASDIERVVAALASPAFAPWATDALQDLP